MADSRVAQRYASALFHTAVTNDVVSSVEDDLNGIANLLATDESFKDFILSPQVSREEKTAIAEKIFGDRITAITMSALRLTIEKGREPELTLIRDEFAELRRKKSGILYVTVETAFPLDNDQRMALEMKLAKGLGKTIEAVYDVEPNLIGGIRVTYNDLVLDGSVRGNLRKLREHLRFDVLKQA